MLFAFRAHDITFFEGVCCLPVPRVFVFAGVPSLPECWVPVFIEFVPNHAGGFGRVFEAVPNLTEGFGRVFTERLPTACFGMYHTEHTLATCWVWVDKVVG